MLEPSADPVLLCLSSPSPCLTLARFHAFLENWQFLCAPASQSHCLSHSSSSYTRKLHLLSSVLCLFQEQVQMLVFPGVLPTDPFKLGVASLFSELFVHFLVFDYLPVSCPMPFI